MDIIFGLCMAFGIFYIAYRIDKFVGRYEEKQRLERIRKLNRIRRRMRDN